ncbi:DUF58 domain-containing protein, partial [Protofrankia symbiont of Coriaria myrtifolia]|uniref:DUF58 domain-containing protein n=1 Tax=Protofrankia symbiont of Coriaria myrtifolia TaxID=1306540 RepID=UPI0013F15F57
MVTGLVCCGLAVVVGEKDLLRVGLLLLALPVCATAFVCRTRYRLACHRRLVPARATVGAVVSVSVRIDNMSRRSSSVLLVDDDIPAHLGFRARFVLDRVEPGGARYFTYQLRPQLRGRYLIGPMAIRITDPFGLCELTRTFRSRGELVVTPPVETLSAARPGRQTMIGDLRQRDRPTMGTDDFVTRPYQAGDDLRRIHWRTSARAGELMVRREESSRPASATVLLDTRSAAWTGQGPASSFEWAVSAAGSVAVHLAESDHLVDLICDGGVPGVTTTPGTGRSRNPTRSPTALLDALAVVTTSDAGPPPRTASPGPSIPSRRDLTHLAGDGMLVAVLGATEPARAGMLARTRPRGALATVVLVDVTTWDENHSVVRQDAARQETARPENLHACRAVFQRHGWTVIVAGYGDTLAALWPRASERNTAGGGGGSGAGHRAGSPTTGLIHNDRPAPPQPRHPLNPNPPHPNSSNSSDMLHLSDQPLEWPSTAGSATAGSATAGSATPGSATVSGSTAASQAAARPASGDSAARDSAARNSAAREPTAGRPAAAWPTTAGPAAAGSATGDSGAFPPDAAGAAPLPASRQPAARPTA